MRKLMQHFKMAALISGWIALVPTVTEAAIQKELGPYSVELTSNPSVIPSSGPAKLSLRVYVGGISTIILEFAAGGGPG